MCDVMTPTRTKLPKTIKRRKQRRAWKVSLFSALGPLFFSLKFFLFSVIRNIMVRYCSRAVIDSNLFKCS